MQDDELVTFILAGLDFDYNPLVSTVLGCTTPISLSDLYSQLLAYDARLQLLQDNHNNGHNSSVNAASRAMVAVALAVAMVVVVLEGLHRLPRLVDSRLPS